MKKDPYEQLSEFLTKKQTPGITNQTPEKPKRKIRLKKKEKSIEL